MITLKKHLEFILPVLFLAALLFISFTHLFVFDATTVEVKITGKASDLADLVAENITGSVDVSGLGAGKHTVSVTLDLDSGISATAATTNITITTE